MSIEERGREQVGSGIRNQVIICRASSLALSHLRMPRTSIAGYVSQITQGLPGQSFTGTQRKNKAIILKSMCMTSSARSTLEILCRQPRRDAGKHRGILK